MTIEKSEYDFLKRVSQVIFDKKGFNIVTIDVREISTLTDFFIIAEGNVDQHVKAIIDAVEEKGGRKPLNIDGAKSGGWMLLDYGSCIVHVMTSEFRERYALEQVWKEGKIVDIPLEIEEDSDE